MSDEKFIQAFEMLFVIVLFGSMVLGMFYDNKKGKLK